jgi:hypothetical protein
MSSDPAFWLQLLVKMAVTAGFVIVATSAAERVGPLIGGMIATLPIAAGPSYAFLAMDHGTAFLEQSALASMVINGVTSVFALAYAALAQRYSLAISAGGALAIWVALAFLVRLFPWTTASAMALSGIVVCTCIALGEGYRNARMPLARRRWYDIPLRAGMVAVLVATVIALSAAVGPTVTGIIAVFPIVLFSLMLILHPRIGGPATAAVLANTLLGMAGFLLTCLTLHLTVVRLGAAISLSLALAVSVVCNLVFWMARMVLAARAARRKA